MAHHNTVLSQILCLVPRHDFKRLEIEHDGKRRTDAMSRWSQFVSMAEAQGMLGHMQATMQNNLHI